MNRMTTALMVLGAMFLVLLVIVAGNDAGHRVETALLQGTAQECDSLYHAIWKVKGEPSHSTLVSIAESLDCPFNE